MRRSEAGFTLVEVVVAFAVVAAVLGALYALMAGALRGEAGAVARDQALAAARDHLEAIGIEQPLTAGESTGVYASGISWRLVIEPVETQSSKGHVFRIVLQPLGPAARPLARLETFKLAPRAN